MALTPVWDLKVWYPPGRLSGAALAIRGLACAEIMPPCIIDRPRGTGDWLFMGFPDDVCLRIDDREQTVAGPLLMVWGPRQGHWYGHRTARYSHSWIHAKGPALDALMAAVAVPQGVPIFGFPLATLLASVTAIHREMDREWPDQRMVMLHLEALAREAARAAGPVSQQAPATWLEIRRWIDEHFSQRLTLAGLARRFTLSPQHLCEGFHRWFGVPPIEYQIRLRLDRARLLLSDRNRSIASVAAEVGWHDTPHFCRMFRRRCGATPRQIRGKS